MIPLVDVQRQCRDLRGEIDSVLAQVFDRGDFILGEQTRAFEREFAEFCGAPFCVGVASGTDALLLALLALGIGPGDEVIAPANTFIATILAISQTGAQPVLVDCEPIYYNIDAWAVERALTPRTKAIVPVHLYGHPADMDPLLETARHRNLSIVEDAAQAHGAAYKGRLCGTLGDVGCFSFYPGKNLGAYGDAGAIITHQPEVARRIAALRNYGQRQKNVHLTKGFNSRLDTLQAAVLRVKLRHLQRWNERRTAAAARYAYLLRSTGLRLPETAPWAIPAWHLFVAQTRDRLSLQSALHADEIGHGIHYPTPVHLQEAFRDLGYVRGSFPVAEWLASRIISLPLFPEITDAELQRVARACRRAGSADPEQVRRMASVAPL